MCKLAIFSDVLPVKSPRLLGVGVVEIRLGHQIYIIYASRNIICSGVTEWISCFTRWQLFSSGMFLEVLPGGIIRCSGVNWWISDLTRWNSYIHAVLLINSIGYFIFAPHA